MRIGELAGQKVQQLLIAAPGDGNPIGGIKVIAQDGWFAACPSGTEDIYKIYAESFLGKDHLQRIQPEAQTTIAETLARSGARAAGGYAAERFHYEQSCLQQSSL